MSQSRAVQLQKTWHRFRFQFLILGWIRFQETDSDSVFLETGGAGMPKIGDGQSIFI